MNNRRLGTMLAVGLGGAALTMFAMVVLVMALVAGKPATASPSQARFSTIDIWLTHSTRVPLQVEQAGNGRALRVIAKGTPALEVYSDASTVIRDTVILPIGAAAINGTPAVISGFVTMTPTPTSTPTNTPTNTPSPTATP